MRAPRGVIRSEAKNLPRPYVLHLSRPRAGREGPTTRRYHVYITASLPRTIYVGVTNDLAQRVFQHRKKMVPGFTSKYNITRLVYTEEGDDVRDAIAREKQLKGWRRKRKMALIESVDPEWDDLAETWFATEQDSSLRSE